MGWIGNKGNYRIFYRLEEWSDEGPNFELNVFATFAEVRLAIVSRNR